MKISSAALLLLFSSEARADLTHRNSTIDTMGVHTKPHPTVEMFDTCWTAISRLKEGPANFPEIIKKGELYTDKTFKKDQQLAWPLFYPVE